MPNVELRGLMPTPAFRRVAVGTWHGPGDPQVYGSVTVRMEPALAYIEAYRAATGRRLTVTHLVAKAAGLALAKMPDANSLLRFGRIYQRAKISVFLQVAMEDPETGKPDLSGATLHAIDGMSLSEVLDATENSVEKVRTGKDEQLERSRGLFSAAPALAVAWLLKLISFLLYTLNLDLSGYGMPKDGFGSIMVTNIGSLGLDEAYAPLVPFSRVPIVVTVGRVMDTPVVDDGEVVPGKVMRVGATLDHRLVDGAHAKVLVQTLVAAFADPEAAFGPPGEALSDAG